MQTFLYAFINKCLHIIVMFFPILIWDVFAIFQCFVPFPKNLFGTISIACVLFLFFTILFGNSFIYTQYTEKEELIVCFQKPNKVLILKNVLLGIPIIMSLILYASIPFYFYGIFQFIHMIKDKQHQTLSEKLYEHVFTYITNHKEKKERFLA